jgi:alpha-amylase
MMSSFAPVLLLAGLGGAGLAQAQAPADVAPVPVTRTQSDLAPGWNRHAAFMEIFVRSYKDSDGDGTGDLKGLTSQLDYLQSLGVTGLWLMPMGPSEDKDHGYAVNDYRAINPQYGTMADFQTLIAEAHKRGIGIILDFVINHSGSGNPIFKDAAASKQSLYRDWFIFRDEDPKWKGFQWGPWRKSETGYYYGVFDTAMPDWNLKNPKVISYLSDTMRFWMNKGVDGFRIDAVTMLTETDETHWFNQPENPVIVAKLKAVLEAYDNRYLICEASEKPEMYARSCQNAFAFGSQTPLVKSVKSGKAEPDLIKALQAPDRDAMPLVLQSHDAYVGDRLINQFGVNHPENYKLAAALSVLGSRTPFSYYGEEIGMSHNGTYDDPGLRAPMSWTGDEQTAGFTAGRPYRNPAINVASRNVADEAADPNSLLSAYRALYQVRLRHPVIATGAFTLLSGVGDPYLAFMRSDKTEDVLIILNLSGEAVPVILPLSGAVFSVALDTGAAPQLPMVKSDAGGRLNLSLAAKSTLVLVRPKPK